jgi:hypothetical protein
MFNQFLWRLQNKPFRPLFVAFVFIRPIYVSSKTKMDASIKSLTITGPAAEDATRARLKASGLGSRRKRNPVKDEEDDFIEQAKKLSIKPLQQAPVEPPVVKVEVKPVVQLVKPEIQTNVILNPPKQSRVKLQPKVHSVKHVEPNTTRKARRIKLNVSNLTHRFTRAKKVKDDTEKKPMESVREYLVQKGVIQAKSKAPEKMLRSMYADFMLLKDQAL